MSDQRLKIAVFIDFDNVEIGVKTTLGRQFDVGAVLEAIKERGEIITKVAYGDWKRAGDHGRAMSLHAVRLVQRVMTPGGDKNGADINLALDALEMAFTHDHINAFVIVGGDSDFITLVEKLKQYDKKVFVVGGRAFTSQVMQKNCTEFIAYENIAGNGISPAAGARPSSGPRPDRGRTASSPLDAAFPLVKRALKVLSDREVSPQLGLLKSTLLQLDSSFSERDYGASTFRDFAEKLEKQGLVTLKHSGRTTIVEMIDGDEDEEARAPIAPSAETRPQLTEDVEEASHPQVASDDAAGERQPVGSLADGVALVRAILAEGKVQPRWPMYLRQMKQFIRAARPDFDERKYGSLVDLMRACQKDGLVRLERDRQGGLRAFAGVVRPTPVPLGWSVGHDAEGIDLGPSDGDGDGSERSESFGNVALDPPPPADSASETQPPIEDSVIDEPQPDFDALEAAKAAAKPARGRRTRKTDARSEVSGNLGAADKPKRARKVAAKAPARRAPRGRG